MTDLCQCGCGQTPQFGKRFVWPHQSRLANHTGTKAKDDRAVAYYTGAADARNQRPRRVDIADTSAIGDAYTRGYNSLAGVPA